jgi:hypothetical protein
MASLANQTISSTYDGLIKTSTDQPVGVSGVQLLEDGVGNTLALSVGRANQGVTVTGTLTATTLAGTLSTAAQPNVTSVGTLTNLTVTNDVRSGQGIRIGAATDGTTGQFLTDGTNTFLDYNGFLAVRRSSSSAEAMRINSSGNVGIGTTSPTSKLMVLGGGSVPFRWGDSSALGTLTYSGSDPIIQSNTGNLLFYSASTESMRITSGGVLTVGTTDSSPYVPTEGFIVAINNGTKYGAIFGANSTSEKGAVVFVNPNGLVGSITTNGSATAYNTSSDYRLKENVVPMEGALDRVDALKPSRFNFIADPETTVDGFLAHQVAEIVPEAITGEKDAVDEEGNPIYQGIDQSKIVPLLVGAIQELRAEIESLKSQING